MEKTNMMNYLSYKLKTQSISEHNSSVVVGQGKIDEHDSGTESDGDLDIDNKDSLNHDTDAKTDTDSLNERQFSSTESPSTSSNLAAYNKTAHLMYDHSSEEELEVINGPSSIAGGASTSTANLVSASILSNRGTADSVASSSSIDPEMYEESPKRASSTFSETRKRSLPQSSDDEVRNLLDMIPTPVNFRTSPPLEALKPNRNLNLMFRSTTPLILTETSRGIENIKISCDSSNRGDQDNDVCIELEDGNIGLKNGKFNKDSSAFFHSIKEEENTCNILNSGQLINKINQHNQNNTSGGDDIGNVSPSGEQMSTASTSAAVVSIGSALDLRSVSPPAKLFHCAVSPRRRPPRTHHAPQRLQRPHRPCLDFDKMQQVCLR